MDIQAYIQSGVIESYVLELASEEEVAELELLRSHHPEIQQAIEEFSELLEQESFRQGVEPAPELKARIMSAIKEDSKEDTTPFVSLSTQNEEHKLVSMQSGVRWKMIAAASIILFVASAFLNYYLFNKYSQRNEAYQALLSERNTLQANNQVYQTHLKEWQTAAEMMADPTMSMIKLNGVPGREKNIATVFWNKKTKDVFVMPIKLPPAAAGKQYQLWALVDGKPVDAGVLDPTCTGICRMKNIPNAQTFAVTLEIMGGSPSPHLEELYVIGNV